MITKEELKRDTMILADIINVKPRLIRIASMKHKLGSCSPKKIVTFNVSVLSMDRPQRTEVIVHELLHLRYKNHGKMFNVMLKHYLDLYANVQFEPQKDIFQYETSE